MNRKTKIAVIGTGGRTGTMLASELSNSSEVLGVSREREVDLIKKEKFFIKRGKESEAVFRGEIIQDTEFNQQLCPDILFLATKNPVSLPLKFYLNHCKGKIPAVIVSQNGIAAIKDAQESIKEILGEEAERVRLIRVVLFNPIAKKEISGRALVSYSLPIKGAFAKVAGAGSIEDIAQVFKEAGFEFQEFPLEEAKNIEFSKLFLNLIGMAAASKGISVKEGLKDKNTFREEVGVLKEYIKSVKTTGGKFINFSSYPVGVFASLIEKLPISFLLPFRSKLARIISKGREGKPKDLDEIDYYNGAIVDLGKETGVKTPVNEEIIKRVSEGINFS
jgi:2-dehydropantoate 2-reductase